MAETFLSSPYQMHLGHSQLLERTFTSTWAGRGKTLRHSGGGGASIRYAVVPQEEMVLPTPPKAHPRSHSLPPSGPWSTSRGGRLGGGCCRWHRCQQRDTRHMECSWGAHHSPPTAVPSEVLRAECPPVLGFSAPWATPRTQTLWAQGGTRWCVSMPGFSFFIE